MSNTHPQLAELRVGGVHEWQSEEGSTDATNIAAILDAQVEATLALAYEQRTANLIALLQTPNLTGHDGSQWGIMLELREELFNEAAVRLELPETPPREPMPGAVTAK